MRPRWDDDGNMKLSVDDIKTSPAEAHFAEDVAELNLTLSEGNENGYRFPKPLQVNLTHFRSGKDLILSGTIAGELIGACSRCLEEYVLPINRGFSVTLSPQRTMQREVELNADELSADFYREEYLDLSALVQEETILALPSRPLCREDCRGLCSQCGTNLNLESCSCRPLWHDPRLAVLSTLRLPSQG
jgi:uncharacterized protein